MPNYIAGCKTADDWRAMRTRLIHDTDQRVWKTAFEEFFLARLHARYFEPIKVLQDNGTFRGEGFSIVTIQCSIVEFLETTRQGSNYRLLRRNETLGPHEYSSSKDVFVSFLT